jgi:hypothetical protein
VLHTLRPQLARPIAEVSDAQMTALVASHPPQEETDATWSLCWQQIFWSDGAMAAVSTLHKAFGSYVDVHSPDYASLPRYMANIAMPPEVRRNTKALLALKPTKMSPPDAGTWMMMYDTILAEVIHPIGLPGLHEYEQIREPEWVINDVEAEYVAIFEAARSAPTRDGVFDGWMADAGHWLFGPPPAATRSIVFNLDWEQGAAHEGGTYGLQGVVIVGQTATVPPPVRAFLDHLEKNAPPAVGGIDSAAWINVYNGRAVRALGDVPQKEPILTSTDALALDLLEEMRPKPLRGAFTYGVWLDLVVLAKGQDDPAWARRFLPLEPCVEATELAAAQQTFGSKVAPLASRGDIPPPHVCPQ